MSTWQQGPDITSGGVTTVVTVADVGTPHTIGDKIKMFGVDGAETLNNFVFTFISTNQIDLAEHGLAVLPSATYNSGGAYTLNPDTNSCRSVLSVNAHPIVKIDAAQSIGNYSPINLEGNNRGTVYKRDPAPLDYLNGDRTAILTPSSPPITNSSLPLYDIGYGTSLSLLVNGNTAEPILWAAEVRTAAYVVLSLSAPAVMKSILFQLGWQGGFGSAPVVMKNITIWGRRKGSQVLEALNNGVLQDLAPVGGYAELAIDSNQAYEEFRFEGETVDWSTEYPTAPILEFRAIGLKNYNDRISVDMGQDRSVSVLVITDIVTNSDARLMISATGRDGGTYNLYTPIDLINFGNGTVANIPPSGSALVLDESFNLVLNLPPLFDNIVNMDFLDVIDEFWCSGVYLYDSINLDSGGIAPTAKVTYKSLDDITITSNHALRKEVSGDLKIMSFDYIEKTDDDQSRINKALRDRETVVIDLFPSADIQKRMDNVVVGLITDNKSASHSRLRGSFKLSVMESKAK